MDILALHQRFRRMCTLEEGLAVRTVRMMESFIRTFVRRTGAESLVQITPDLLRGFFSEGVERHQWGYWHFVNHRKHLKKFLDWAVSEGHLPSNPISAIRKPRKPQSLPRRLTQEEARRVLYASFNHDWRYAFERSRNHAIIATFLFTGIRASELTALQAADVNIEGGVLLVRHGKGNKDRYVPIHHKLTHVLRRYLDDRRRLRKMSPHFFTGAHSDRPLAYKDVNRICRKLSKASGVKFTAHCLRHTFGSVAIEDGIGIVPLKELMGHAEISSTMLYVKMSPEGLKENLNRLDLF